MEESVEESDEESDEEIVSSTIHRSQQSSALNLCYESNTIKKNAKHVVVNIVKSIIHKSETSLKLVKEAMVEGLPFTLDDTLQPNSDKLKEVTQRNLLVQFPNARYI